MRPLQFITKVLIIPAIVVLCVSCEQRVKSREYEEIIIESPLKSKKGMHANPHAFMDMGFDHPDISQMVPMDGGQNDPQLQKQLDASVAKLPLSWKAPSGWSETKGSGMRLVTFTSGSIECSIVSLGGQAGGLEQNIIRWMRQVNIAIPDADQLKSFISNLESIGTQGGFSLKVADLTGFTNNDSPSMITAIAQLQDKTIFIKMTGPRESLLKNREQFNSLCKSLKIN